MFYFDLEIPQLLGGRFKLVVEQKAALSAGESVKRRESAFSMRRRIRAHKVAVETHRSSFSTTRLCIY